MSSFVLRTVLIVALAVGAALLVRRIRSDGMSTAASERSHVREQAEGSDGKGLRAPASGQHSTDASVAALAPPDPLEHWRDLLAQPSSIERDAELAVTLEELAGRNSLVATDLLKGLSDRDRQSIVRALLAGSAHRPERAMQLANAFLQADPAGARNHGFALLYVLTHTGEYESAVRFVLQQNASGGESENPVEWLKVTFQAWAADQPQVAAAQVLALPSESLREEALQAVASTWAKSDPAAAIAFVQQLPFEAERRTAIEAALRSWTETNPAAVATWLAAQEPKPEFNHPIARVVGTERFADLPDDGLALASRITDPELRSHVTAQILRRLAEKDPRAAAQRADASSVLLPVDKASVSALVNRPPE